MTSVHYYTCTLFSWVHCDLTQYKVLLLKVLFTSLLTRDIHTDMYKQNHLDTLLEPACIQGPEIV